MTQNNVIHKYITNPCIGYCLLNEKNICTGCGRSKDERTDWIFLSESEKQQVVEVAGQRLTQIKSEQENDPNSDF